MCNVALPTIERSPPQAGSNPGPLDQWTKATGAPLQNKPCKDGWVEEGGPTCTIIRRISLIHHQLKTVFQKAKKTIFIFYAKLERRHSRVVRAAWLRCRKTPEGREFEAGLRYPTTGKLSSNQRRIRQQKEKDGLCLSSAVPKIAPNVPTAITLWETFIFTYYAENKNSKAIN